MQSQRRGKKELTEERLVDVSKEEIYCAIRERWARGRMATDDYAQKWKKPESNKIVMAS
jgi:hypothetical protein